MSDLVEFLAARLDEDEAVARRNIGAGPGWAHGLGDTDEYGPSWPDYQTFDDDDLAAAYEFLSRFRPLRMLREIEGSRRIAGIHRIGHDPCDAHDARLESIPCDTIRALAAIWRDHPDYDESWKP